MSYILVDSISRNKKNGTKPDMNQEPNKYPNFYNIVYIFINISYIYQIILKYYLYVKISKKIELLGYFSSKIF